MFMGSVENYEFTPFLTFHIPRIQASVGCFRDISFVRRVYASEAFRTGRRRWESSNLDLTAQRPWRTCVVAMEGSILVAPAPPVGNPLETLHTPTSTVGIHNHTNEPHNITLTNLNGCRRGRRAVFEQQ